LRKFRSL